MTEKQYQIATDIKASIAEARKDKERVEQLWNILFKTTQHGNEQQLRDLCDIAQNALDSVIANLETDFKRI